MRVLPRRDGPDDVRRLARTLNETAAKLETLVRSQEDFVADASHQLRTPLTALRLRLENLERDVAAPGRETLAAARHRDGPALAARRGAPRARAAAGPGRARRGDRRCRAGGGARGGVGRTGGGARPPHRDRRDGGPGACRRRSGRAGARQPARERGRGFSARQHDPPQLRTTRTAGSSCTSSTKGRASPPTPACAPSTASGTRARATGRASASRSRAGSSRSTRARSRSTKRSSGGVDAVVRLRPAD